MSRKMVETQIKVRGIRNPKVIKAMTDVPRDAFVLDTFKNFAFSDSPLPIDRGQTISQPYIVAFMTEILQPREDAVVLEIGTGSGYQTAVLAELAAQVYTVEIVRELSEKAQKKLTDLGYKNIKYKIQDGNLGWPEAGPFDAIMVTAAAPHMPKLLLEQLNPGGRMIIPVGPESRVQNLVLVEKSAKNTYHQTTVMAVRFVPLVQGDIR